VEAEAEAEEVGVEAGPVPELFFNSVIIHL
jgi:hypothetical protein